MCKMYARISPENHIPYCINLHGWQPMCLPGKASLICCRKPASLPVVSTRHRRSVPLLANTMLCTWQHGSNVRQGIVVDTTLNTFIGVHQHWN